MYVYITIVSLYPMLICDLFVTVSGANQVLVQGNAVKIIAKLLQGMQLLVYHQHNSAIYGYKNITASEWHDNIKVTNMPINCVVYERVILRLSITPSTIVSYTYSTINSSS